MSCWQQNVVIHPQLDCPISCTRSQAAASMHGGINCCAIELLQGSNPSTSGACCLLTAWSPAACKCSQDALGARTGFLNNAEVRLPTHFCACGVCRYHAAWLYVYRQVIHMSYVTRLYVCFATKDGCARVFLVRWHDTGSQPGTGWIQPHRLRECMGFTACLLCVCSCLCSTAACSVEHGTYDAVSQKGWQCAVGMHLRGFTGSHAAVAGIQHPRQYSSSACGLGDGSHAGCMCVRVLSPTLCVRLASATRTPLSCVHVIAPVLRGMTELAEQPFGGELCKASSLLL